MWILAVLAVAVVLGLGKGPVTRQDTALMVLVIGLLMGYYAAKNGLP